MKYYLDYDYTKIEITKEEFDYLTKQCYYLSSNNIIHFFSYDRRALKQLEEFRKQQHYKHSLS